MSSVGFVSLGSSLVGFGGLGVSLVAFFSLGLILGRIRRSALELCKMLRCLFEFGRICQFGTLGIVLCYRDMGSTGVSPSSQETGLFEPLPNVLGRRPKHGPVAQVVWGVGGWDLIGPARWACVTHN